MELRKAADTDDYETALQLIKSRVDVNGLAGDNRECFSHIFSRAIGRRTKGAAKGGERGM